MSILNGPLSIQISIEICWTRFSLSRYFSHLLPAWMVKHAITDYISELNKVQWKCILLALSYTNKVSFQLLISYDITSLLCKTAKVYAFKTERTPSKRCHNRRYSLMKSKTLFLSFFLCVDVLIELLLIDTWLWWIYH